MSKKRNVAYVRPQEPSFLTKLKEEAGYVAGPTIDTKREELPLDSDSDSERVDEKPVVVVLNPGDLTAEEADKLSSEKELEEANAKADLTQRVIFQKPDKTKRKVDDSKDSEKKVKKQKKDIKKQLLSFSQADDEY